MTVRLHSEDLQELFVESQYPERYSSTDPGGITEREYPAELLGGKGSYRELFMENIHVGFGNLRMPDGLKLGFESEMESVELHFALRGDTFAEEIGTSNTFEFGINQHNILYASQFKGRAQYLPGDHVQIFEVNLRPAFFQRFLPQENRAILAFISSLNQKKSTLLSPQNYPITYSMHRLIQEVLQCKRKGIFKRMFIESKVTELLLLQLEQILSLQPPGSSPLKKKEVELIYAVREYLLKHLAVPQSLAKLAHEFGTNEFALKKGFKAVFGTTVFTFWQTARMEEAKHLLVDEELNIGEVADRMGYQHPQHFSTAFKRQFGYPPSRLR
ncbi:MAG: AraC family transcriptional regulator [Bacteroidota bacterium]